MYHTRGIGLFLVFRGSPSSVLGPGPARGLTDPQLYRARPSVIAYCGFGTIRQNISHSVTA